jgi:UDP-glucose 6-dehydrogenase
MQAQVQSYKQALILAIQRLNEEQCKALVNFILKYEELESKKGVDGVWLTKDPT